MRTLPRVIAANSNWFISLYFGEAKFFVLEVAISVSIGNVRLERCNPLCVDNTSDGECSPHSHLFLPLALGYRASDGPLQYFWKWSTFSSYLVFTAAFAVASMLITSALRRCWLFVYALGLTALFTEAILGVPQFVRNYQNQSTKGMR